MMAAGHSTSALYGQLLGDPETAALFTGSAEVRAMMLVLGALAKAQGAVGLIPADAAAYLHRASFDLQIDPAALAAETAVNGVPVPALITAFQKAAGAPDLTRWLHWGATSQDIIDTALVLRIKRLAGLWDTRLVLLIRALGLLAEAHADLPMAGRTYGQAATPTSFGAVVASWGRPMLRHRARLAACAAEAAQVSLSGAAGTLSIMGDLGPQVRAAMAETLGLRDCESSWHAERDSIAAFGAEIAGLTASLGKMGEDLILLTQSGIGEVTISGAGGSSTMAHKQNPIGPSVLVALARQAIGLSSTLQGAVLHRQQRDGAAWFTERLTLPPLCIAAGRALTLAADLAERITPQPQAMQAGLAVEGGLIQSEALTFALTSRMSRQDAAKAARSLSIRVRAGEGDLINLAKALWPDLLVLQDLGTAPAQARAFARDCQKV